MFLLFDIGGTYMRAAISQDGTTLGFVNVLPTPSSFKEGMFQFKEMTQALCSGLVTATSVGIAGTLNKEKSLLYSAPNLGDWVKKPLKRIVQRMVCGTVYIQNDAALAGLGEAHFGAGEGKRIVMYYTVSTGVGGARIVNGHIDEGSFEPGHQVIICPVCVTGRCARLLYLEEFISGRGLMMRYQKDPSHIHNQKVWDEAARWLAYGLNNSIVHWSPEVIVLGGGLINHNAISIVKVREYLKQTLRVFPSPPPIKKAHLGDEAGLYGALIYIKQQVAIAKPRTSF